MKSAVVLFACFAAVQCFYSPYKRPSFDCDKWCKHRPVEPRCSESGKTFRNECYLKCAWEYEDCNGVCPCTIEVQRTTYCTCPKAYQPVCTVWGETRDNKCVADCEGKPIAHEGRCFEY